MYRKTIHYSLCGLEYVYLIDAPIGVDGEDEFIDLPPKQIEKMIATSIVTAGVPLRGKEVLFLRKALGRNRNHWADALGMTASGILRWEQDLEKRLSRINEVAVRMLCAEDLGIEIEWKWSKAITSEEVPKRLEVAA